MYDALSTPVLYTFRRCPYAMRARLALSAAQIVYEHREVDLKKKPSHMIELSPKATVPVLWLPKAIEEPHVLDESLNIMFWALKQDDPLHWLPQNERDMQRATELIENNDGAFKQQLDQYKYPNRYSLGPGDALIKRQAALDTLQKLEKILHQSTFLSGAEFGLLDAALAPFIRQFAKVDEAWFTQLPLERLIKWLNQFEGSQLFLNVMKKYPNWADA